MEISDIREDALFGETIRLIKVSTSVKLCVAISTNLRIMAMSLS